MTPAHGGPGAPRRNARTGESFERLEPLPTFGDTGRAIGVTAVVLLVFQLVTFYAVAADVQAETAATLARGMALLPPVVFAASLTRRTARRARAAGGARGATPARAGTLRYDLAYAVALGLLLPAMGVPILLAYTSVTAALAGPILAVPALAAGVATFLGRRRQRSR